jgi:SSS family solute:Na+ symporter
MPTTLAWQDHAMIVAYLGATIGLGLNLSRKQASDDEYFLASRRMPWFAVGLSVIATLLSSLTYLSEPGEVWKSGVINVMGKMLAIPFEMLLVWLVCIPFLMRFRYTSAYEYLGDRFGRGARLLGVAIFAGLVVTWMGFIVLASARAMATVTGLSLGLVIATVGVVATIYTVLGGLRAVIWTDVIQVLLMLGGAAGCIVFVALNTNSGLTDWYQAALDYQAASDGSRMKLFSWDPFERSTMLTVALSMFVWHVATHTANQMTVQRYFSTPDLRAARRSFVTGSLFGVALNLLLVVVGLALLYYYVNFLGERLPEGLDPAKKNDADLIFPKFVVAQLPAGLAGGIMAAILAAAMSSIDSGINSLAAVLSVEHRDWPSAAGPAAASPSNHTPGQDKRQVKAARLLTFFLGLLITLAAYGLDLLPGQGNIVEMMARTFNSFIGSLGGLFFIGMFMPRAGNAAAVLATFCGLAASLVLGYGDAWGLLPARVSFTLIVPGSLAASLLAGLLLSFVFPRPQHPLDGLTWFSRGRD